MADVYDKFNAATGNISAYAVMLDGDMIGKVVIKGKTAYCHYLGTPMQFGMANGGGYDLQSAACSYAAEKAFKHSAAIGYDMGVYEKKFWTALGKSGHLERNLRDAGFIAFMVV